MSCNWKTYNKSIVRRNHALGSTGGCLHILDYHVGAIVSLAIVKEQSWSATSNIFKKYTEIVEDNSLKYRRISDLLVELENTGILVSRAYSRGMGGYGKEYKLKVDPGVIDPSVSEKFYDSQIQRRAEADRLKGYQKLLKSRGRSNLANMYSRLFKDF